VSDQLLLVGSIPMDTPEEVFRAFGGSLGPSLAYLPDGEVGERRFWVDGLAYRVFNGHPELETTRRPAPDENGVENWQPRGRDDEFRFRVRPGVEHVRFGDPGWRLGYARDAIGSYSGFRHLKAEGVIPEHVRFQVCLPLPYSSTIGFFDEEDLERVVPGLTEAFRAEVANMVGRIPNDELAIQWDLALENRFTERHLERGDVEAARAEAARMTAPLRELSSVIPEEVALGFHSCFGTIDGWPSRQPVDVTGTVLLLNAAAAAAGRRVDWVHFPTVASSEEAWFRPLEDLDVGDARVYVGAIHHLHGPGGIEAQLHAVRKVVPDFGLAAPCGFGRAPERPGRLLDDDGGLPPDPIRAIIDEHTNVAGLVS
jgi:hypothetical protein